jgi:hypothetical protein
MERYADRIRMELNVATPATSVEAICQLKPQAVIFQSIQNLEASQDMVTGLANCDIPIIVCASAADQLRTRDLGADYFLIHPLVYDGFLAVLNSIISQKPRLDDGVPP